MLIALHIDPENWARLLGIWVAPEGSTDFPECYYPEPGDGLEEGRGRMQVKGPAVPWSAFFWRLQQASPYSAYWSVREEPSTTALADLYGRLAVEVVDSAAALAAAPPSGNFQPVVPDAPGKPPTAAELCARIGGPTSKFAPSQKLSTLCEFFADDDRLVVVARAEQPQAENRELVDIVHAHEGTWATSRSASSAGPTRPARPPDVRYLRCVGCQRQVTSSLRRR